MMELNHRKELHLPMSHCPMLPYSTKCKGVLQHGWHECCLEDEQVCGYGAVER